MDVKYSELKAYEFADKLFSKDAVPGGGGASALIGALAASLAGMVCNLTAGKKTYAVYEADILRLRENAESLKNALLNMIDEDAENFLPLSKAYSLPKTTEEEKRRREEIMQECLKQACETPLNIVKAAYEAALINEELSEKGSRLAVSDAGCGAAAARAALTGAWLNVEINLGMIKDEGFARKVNDEVKPLVEKGVDICDSTYDKVLEKLKGEN